MMLYDDHDCNLEASERTMLTEDESAFADDMLTSETAQVQKKEAMRLMKVNVI